MFRALSFLTLIIVSCVAMGQTSTAGIIVWVDPDGDGQTPDQEGGAGWVNVLAGAGHTVVGQSLANGDGSLTNAEKASLNGADLVILGGDGFAPENFGADWNGLTVPLIAMNSRVIDNSWGWAGFAGASSAGTRGSVLEPNDPIFNGVSQSSPLTTHASTVRFGGANPKLGGTKLLESKEGFTVIGRWNAADSGGVLAGDRMFFAATLDGTDFPVYSLASVGETLFLNSVESLIAIPEPSSVILFAAAVIPAAFRRRKR